jgi:hypothetical protein
MEVSNFFFSVFPFRVYVARRPRLISRPQVFVSFLRAVKHDFVDALVVDLDSFFGGLVKNVPD